MEQYQLNIPTLTTTRLKLEPLSMRHSDGMFRMWRNSQVQRYSGQALDEDGVEIELPAKTPAESDRLIVFWLRAAADGWGFRWAILLGSNHAFIGHVGFNSLAGWSEIAFHMNPDYWGRGFMTEAAEAAITWRQENGATGIEAFIEPDNRHSIALARRLGMEPTECESAGARRYRMLLSSPESTPR
ncbi:MAG: GNAT family N-acetyltransferase [Pseudomonadales bacterium]|nr:GNAT family N-acetyltransferase [Pseudomonadales bacterium]MCP5183251.1 GNAT family N-acetyltransferase [Pseudomonadales bacterium]